MRKLLCGISIVILVVLAFVSGMFVDTVQANKEVNGIITSDTTWTKANSPYTLAGPVAIAKDVTLTIEPGVQVYFNSHYIQVNGTLIARGSEHESVSFLTSEGQIRFMPSSKSWNEKTGTGCIIENGNIPSFSFKITIDGASPKITSSDSRADIDIKSGSPIFSNNVIDSQSGLIVYGGMPIISNNTVYSRITIRNGAPVISGNTLKYGPRSTFIEVTGGNPLISNNDISNDGIGIFAAFGVIERNHIHGGVVGIAIGNGIIRNNTISSSTSILVKASSKPTIVYNNFGFVDGRENIVLDEGVNDDIDAKDNWWGTTDSQKISQSIVDNKNDFNLGTVNFTPFLTEANPQAMPETGMPTPTPTATSNPTPSQSASLSPSPTSTSNQSGEGIIAFLGLGLTVIVISLLSLITVLLIFIVIFLWKRRIK